MLYLTGLNPLGLGVSKLTNFLVGANNFNNFSGPTGFLCLKHLDLSGSPRIEVELDSWMQPEYFPVLTNLNLSFTGIVTIPESISRFTTLVYLRIEDCKKLREIPLLPYSVRDVCATNCDQLDTESSIILLIHFRVILHFLAATATCFGPERPQIGNLYHLELPVTEIPEWLKFNHRQSVGNSVSFLVGPKFSNLFVCIAFPSKDLDNDTVSMCDVDFFINGERQFKVHNWWAKGNYDHVWLIYGKVNISNTSEENRIVVEFKGQNIPLHRMRIYAACSCCPWKPNIFLASSMEQCAFNNGEEDPGWGEPGDDDGAGGRDNLYYGEPGDDDSAGPSGTNDPYCDGTDDTFYGEPENDDAAVQGGNDDQYYDELEDDDTYGPNSDCAFSGNPRLKFVTTDYRKVRFVNHISSQLQDDEGIDQTVAEAPYLIERMPRYQQVLYLGKKVKPSDPDVFHLLGEVKYKFNASEGILPMARSVRNNGAIAREESTGSSRKNGAITREESDGSARNNGAIAREELASSAKNYGAIPREESVETARNYGAITREESGTSESGGS
ncbi:hypothetical protein CFP56_002554 [Quercus suber]|uniref:Uncharacterized protein n=1 Tax=Quercus suber TaxID=58331 RepID=A0AAW0LE52_QUESU